MILSAHQPAYLPWLGYFHKIQSADVFVWLDKVQYEKNSFINRNQVKSSQGAQWLTIPIHGAHKNINEIECVCNGWEKTHRKTIVQLYGSTIYFKPGLVESWYHEWEHKYMNPELWIIVQHICVLLGIGITKIILQRITGYKNQLLIDLCKKYNCDAFLFGANGRDYCDFELFKKNGIKPLFQEYRTPEYPQRYGEFIPDLSVIDALFNVGPDRTRELICAGRILES